MQAFQPERDDRSFFLFIQAYLLKTPQIKTHKFEINGHISPQVFDKLSPLL